MYTGVIFDTFFVSPNQTICLLEQHRETNVQLHVEAGLMIVMLYYLVSLPINENTIISQIQCHINQ